MQTLQAIQTISKIGKIVSKIVFVCCIVGFCLCVVGIVSLALGAPTFKLGGVTLESILQNKADLTTGTLYASMAAGAIICAGEGVLAKLASHYFERELADGTPFTLGGAQELRRLGVLSIVVPICMQSAVQVVQKILEKVFTDLGPTKPETSVSIAVGLLVLVMALLCRHGAENAGQTDVRDGSDR
ncbi:MAG: hypothetical protein IJT44_01580 [Clostridia bacterium]|nr:hypothetical protein [Clostridia bacterium]